MRMGVGEFICKTYYKGDVGGVHMQKMNTYYEGGYGRSSYEKHNMRVGVRGVHMHMNTFRPPPSYYVFHMNSPNLHPHIVFSYEPPPSYDEGMGGGVHMKNII
jgi:hypothetical protein